MSEMETSAYWFTFEELGGERKVPCEEIGGAGSTEHLRCDDALEAARVRAQHYANLWQSDVRVYEADCSTERISVKPVFWEIAPSLSGSPEDHLASIAWSLSILAMLACDDACKDCAETYGSADCRGRDCPAHAQFTENRCG